MAGRWIVGRGGGEARKATSVLGVALVMWARKRGREHTPLVTLRRISNGHSEELVLRQKHSVHVVAEAHLTVVRAMVRGSKSTNVGAEMRKCRDEG